MARFDRMRYDYRGPEYNHRYGRFEGAYARRIALERTEHERERRRRRRPPPPRPAYEDELRIEDVAYSRRYWPPAQRRAHRMY